MVVTPLDDVFVFAFAGIRDFVSVLLALPLCGAAPTFLCSGVQTGDMVDTCTGTSLTPDGQGLGAFRSSFATR